MKNVTNNNENYELFWHMLGEIIGWAIMSSVILIALYFVG